MTVVEIRNLLRTLDRELMMFSRCSFKALYVGQTSYFTVSVNRQGSGWNFDISRVHRSVKQGIRDAPKAGKFKTSLVTFPAMAMWVVGYTVKTPFKLS